MNLQRIKSINGENEYVLVPYGTYEVLKKQIHKLLDEDYVEFKLEKFIENPVALARIKAGLTQEELAERLGVSQAYISKIENQSKTPLKLIEKISGLNKK